MSGLAWIVLAPIVLALIGPPETADRATAFQGRRAPKEKDRQLLAQIAATIAAPTAVARPMFRARAFLI
jgi:hypothetical protein